ncbi:MAG: hypothetical protein ACLFNM_02810 [Candidatus Woesearchaeota archaeon]
MKFSELCVKADKCKQSLEPKLDYVLSGVLLNTIALGESLQTIDALNANDGLDSLLKVGVGAGLFAANKFVYQSEKSKNFRTVAKKVANKVNASRPASWIKTLGYATALSFAVAGYTGSSSQKQSNSNFLKTPFIEHLQQQADSLQEVQEQKEFEIADLVVNTPLSIKARPEMYDELDYDTVFNHEFYGARLNKKNTLDGRLQRTLRWEPIYHSIEEKYNIPKNLLGAIIMQESYGDPLQPNSFFDGGIGVAHMQGTTAKEYGLKIFGDSFSDSDSSHGKELQRLVEDNYYDFGVLYKYDERFHPLKVLDASARIIINGKKTFGSWDRGVRFFRGGSENAKANYLQNIKHWQNQLNSQDARDNAQESFNNINTKIDFETYLYNFHEANYNWGLNKYRQE